MSLIGGVSEGGALNYLGRSRAAVCFKSCAEETYLHLPKLKGTSTMHCCLEGV